MNTPLLTDAEAHARATELVAQFNSDPDVLSPDEQALAMELKALSHARAAFYLRCVLHDCPLEIRELGPPYVAWSNTALRVVCPRCEILVKVANQALDALK